MKSLTAGIVRNQRARKTMPTVVTAASRKISACGAKVESVKFSSIALPLNGRHWFYTRTPAPNKHEPALTFIALARLVPVFRQDRLILLVSVAALGPSVVLDAAVVGPHLAVALHLAVVLHLAVARAPVAELHLAVAPALAGCIRLPPAVKTGIRMNAGGPKYYFAK